jgi:E3 ubiquitin-protein ligase RFWD2
MPQRAREELFRARQRRVQEHFKELQSFYYTCRRRDFASAVIQQQQQQQQPGVVAPVPLGPDSLSEFTSAVTKLTKYSRLKVCSTLKYGDLFNSSNIVSCIDFDRDDEFFATGGVAKKIKIFEYANVVNDTVAAHYPVREMACESKISCLSWNSYIKGQLASSDYEGVVTIWDTGMCTPALKLEEHEKRVWCVDFSPIDPQRLASGSDDTRVKIWSTNQRGSVMTIESKANVCCVKFNPTNSNYIAFGSADHNIHYYDLRSTAAPVNIYRGHRKAVSYVKFMNGSEFISASTDSSLKLWSSTSPECIRTFVGHVNEKNFVGLSCNADYIACGSETNAVFTFCKSLNRPILSHFFRPLHPTTGEELPDDDPTQFVSAVCFKRNSNIIVAANSQGTIKVLEMVSV